MKDVLKLLNTINKNGIKLFVDERGNLKVRGKSNLLNTKLIHDIKLYKREIIKYLSPELNDNPTIQRVERENNVAPASYSQQRLWLTFHLEDSNVHYNMSDSIRIKGNFDLDSAEKSFVCILERHESLRTVFFEKGSVIWQRILSEYSFNIDIVDLSKKSKVYVDSFLEKYVREISSYRFNLEADLMLKVAFLKLPSNSGEPEGILVFNIHHIASDGWSRGVFLREFNFYYRGFLESKEVKLPELPIRYSDYSHWQRNFLESGEAKEKINYWLEHLKELPIVHSLPLDSPRSKYQKFGGKTFEFSPPGSSVKALKKLAESENISLFMMIHALFSILIARYSRCNDVVIGTPIANRPHDSLDPIIGCFVNTLVLRTHVDLNAKFSDYVRYVKSINLAAHKNQDIPFDLLVDRINPDRSSAYSPLFQIQLSLNNTKSAEPHFSEVSTAPFNLSRDKVKYELSLNIAEVKDKCIFRFEYRDELFTSNSIKNLSESLICLIEDVVNSPQASLYELDILRYKTKQFLLNDFNNNYKDLSGSLSLVEMFENRAIHQPDKIALIYEGAYLTYLELYTKINTFAKHLNNKGVSPGKYVALLMERSIELVVAIWAIWKSGGAYVPIDTTLPEERINIILSDCNPHIILTQEEIVSQKTCITNYPYEIVDDSSFVNELEVENYPFSSVSQNNDLSPAYLIYTSGSTGNPKGVICTHKGLLNRLDWMQSEYTLDTNDVVFQKTPYSFDVSLWEFVWPLISGAQLVVAKPGGHQDPSYIVKKIKEHSITTIHFVPSMLQVILLSKLWQECDTVKHVFSSGEILTKELHNLFFDVCAPSKLYNLYGPTEASIDVSYWNCNANSNLSIVPIGKPIQNTDLVVLDEFNQLVIPGGVGELHIGGIGLAQGYLNRADLNESSFIPNPFNELDSERLYRTGDLVRLNPIGELEYLGRVDDQIKLHGLRIEPLEIECKINEIPGILNSKVILREDIPGDFTLAAYYRTDTDTDIESEVIFKELSSILPIYMVPKAYTKISKWPLSTSGKIDKRQLPKPDLLPKKEFIPASSETEIKLISIVSSILALNPERISVTSDFFEIGGSSLSVIKMMNLINESWGIAISIREILSASNFHDLSEEIDNHVIVGYGELTEVDEELEEGWL